MPTVESFFSYQVYKLSPLVSIFYFTTNLYTFLYIFNLWANLDPWAITFACLHLVVPIYSGLFSIYPVPLS